MKKIDHAIEKYNSTLYFFNKRNKIVKHKSDLLVAFDKNKDKPIVLSKTERNANITLIGNIDKANDFYKSFILQKIENNEPFIFVNNTNRNAQALMNEIKDHVDLHEYSFPLIIDDYNIESVNLSDKKKSYIFNTITIDSQLKLTKHNHSAPEDESKNFVTYLLYKLHRDKTKQRKDVSNAFSDNREVLSIVIGCIKNYKDFQYRTLVSSKGFLTSIVTYIPNKNSGFRVDEDWDLYDSIFETSMTHFFFLDKGDEIAFKYLQSDLQAIEKRNLPEIDLNVNIDFVVRKMPSATEQLSAIYLSEELYLTD